MSTPLTTDRLGVTTLSTNGQYDSVVALSQGIINENFKNLFKLNPLLQKIDIPLEGTGIWKAELEPPEILIPAGDLGEVWQSLYFRTAFKSGSILTTTQEALVKDMTGWILTVKCDLLVVRPGEFKPNPDLSPEENEKALAAYKRKLEWINNVYEVPGNYSIELLYAKLSDARWGEPIEKLSQAGYNSKGQPRSLRDWLAINGDAADVLPVFFRKWARKMEEKGNNMLGLSFKLSEGILTHFEHLATFRKVLTNVGPETLKNPAFRPTYEPKALVHQVYPYKKIVKDTDGKDKFAVETGIQGDGNYNCLLYCEIMRDSSLPAELKLTWSGNFAFPETGGKPKADGTFLLGHHLFMEKFILPELQAINKASEITHTDPWTTVDENAYRTAHFDYNVGANPKETDSTTSYFAFTTNFLPDSKYKVKNYTWHKKNSTPVNTQVWPQFGGYKTKIWTNDIMDTTISWSSGTPTIKVEGSATSEERWQISKDETPDQFDPPGSWINDLYTVSWRFDLNIKQGYLVPGKEVVVDQETLSVKDATDKTRISVLTVSIDDGPNHDCNVTCDLKPDRSNRVEMHGHDEAFKTWIKKRLQAQFPSVIKNITTKLSGSGKFVYPGYGKLIFKNPCFNNWGDLIADLEYAPLKEGEFIKVPGAAREGDEYNFDDDESPEEVIGGAPPQELQLQWQIDQSGVMAQKPSSLVIKATNITSEPIYFDAISIFFTAGLKEQDLFHVDEFTKGSPETFTEKISKTIKGLLGTGTDSNEAIQTETGSSGASQTDATKNLKQAEDGSISKETPRVQTKEEDTWVKVDTKDAEASEKSETEPGKGAQKEPGKDLGKEPVTGDKPGSKPPPPPPQQPRKQPIRPKPKSNTLATLETSKDIKDVEFTVKAVDKTGEDKTLYVANMRKTKDKLTLAPKSFVVVALKGPGGSEGNYTVSLKEDWKDNNGKYIGGYQDNKIVKVREGEAQPNVLMF